MPSHLYYPRNFLGEAERDRLLLLADPNVTSAYIEQPQYAFVDTSIAYVLHITYSAHSFNSPHNVELNHLRGVITSCPGYGPIVTRETYVPLAAPQSGIPVAQLLRNLYPIPQEPLLPTLPTFIPGQSLMAEDLMAIIEHIRYLEARIGEPQTDLKVQTHRENPIDPDLTPSSTIWDRILKDE